MRKRNFCYICGSSVTLRKVHGDVSHKCFSCGQIYYENPKPATEVALFDVQGRVLVVRRAYDPYKDKYDLPGGFVESGESFEDCIAREITEEIGLKPTDYGKLSYTSSVLADYPWVNETYQVLSAHFTAKLNGEPVIKADDDVAGYEFIEPHKLDPKLFAWASQCKAIQIDLVFWADKK